MALKALAVEKAKPKDKTYMLKDEDGLYLAVFPSGKKYWRFRYWMNKRENRMSLGEYPLIPLIQARERRDEQLIEGSLFALPRHRQRGDQQGLQHA